MYFLFALIPLFLVVVQRNDALMIKMFGKIRIKRLVMLIGFLLFVTIYLFISSQHHNSFLNKLSGKFKNWLEGQVLGISYEERFCKHVSKWNKSSKYPPVQMVAKQLNIEDGDHVFINGLHCGEWVVALKGTFPNIKLFGVDKDKDSINYIKTLVNGTYRVSEPFALDQNHFDVQFDHAIVDGILSIYSHELQCKTILQMLPMLKAGGSLYIGKSFEQCDERKDIEKYLRKYIHAQILPKCFWSQSCLHRRSDIVEILYSKENHILNSKSDKGESEIVEQKKEKLLIDFSSCATSIFLHKHIVLHSNEKKDHVIPDSKYEQELHSHECTWSQTANSTSIHKIRKDQDAIKKAIASVQSNGLNFP